MYVHNRSPVVLRAVVGELEPTDVEVGSEANTRKNNSDQQESKKSNKIIIRVLTSACGTR